jgi:hypothetical protein
MRNLLALIGAAVVLVAVVGWYRNWYTVETTAGGGGQQSVNIEIDRSRINEDIQKGSDRLHDALERSRKEAKQGDDSKRDWTKPDPKFW